MISDHAIEKQLNQLVKAQPNRVVCLRKTEFGTRIPRGYCGSLQQWFDLEDSRGTQRTMARLRGPKGGYAPVGGMTGPPPELVQLIRARLQSPKYRAMAEARAKARMEAEAASKASPIDIPIAHP
jgi:alpha-D-ribose 1-methylphosphonate 5-triphosphate synthase subunit PhnG